VAIVLVACECIVCAILATSSENEKLLRSFPRLVDDLFQGDPPRIAFIGNSRTQAGILPSVVQERLQTHGIGSTVGKLSYHGTGLSDYYYICQTYLVDADRVPDVVVINFMLPRDNVGLALRLAGRYWSAGPTLPEMAEQDLAEFDDAATMLVARYWSSYRAQRQLKGKMLGKFVPRYEASVLHMTHTQLDAAEARRDAEAALKARQIFQEELRLRLGRLAALSRERGFGLVLMAMPMDYVWKLEDDVQALLGPDAAFRDYREAPGLATPQFRDHAHMNEAGALIYSTFVADQFAEDPQLRALLTETNAPADSASP